MKILLLSPVPPPAGGIATWTQLYLDSEEVKRNNVDIINTSVTGSRVNQFVKKKFIDEAKRTVAIYSQLNNKIKLTSYDIVHINISCSTLGMLRDYLLIKKIKYKKFPLVVHCHCNTRDMVKGKLGNYLFKKICHKANKILCLNKDSQEHIYNISGEKSRIIPNFFDNRILVNLKEKKINDKIKVVLYVGHIVKNKGCEEILEVAKNCRDIKFKMIGFLSEEIKKISNSQNVIYMGEVGKKEVIQEMLNADLLLFPSHTEGFPNVVLEAMACGLPIISTPVGAIPDMIENSGGIFVEVKNTEEIIKAIKKLQNPQIRQSMSDWNKQKVKKSYQLNDVIAQIFNEYSSIR